MPLMNMVINVSGHGQVESSEELQPSNLSYHELKEGKECLTIPSKVPYVPLFSLAYHFVVDPVRVH